MPVIGVALPYMPFGHDLGFTHLPLEYYPILGVMVVAYLVLVEQAKGVFYRKRVGRRAGGGAPSAPGPACPSPRRALQSCRPPA